PYSGYTKHELWLRRHNERLHQARRESFVEHHRQKYNNRMPIWVAIEVWDFGLLSHLFSGLKHADKQKIAAKYGVDGATLAKWLKSLNFIRNVSAHHSRLWNINVLESSALPTGWPVMKNTRAFMYFVILARLLEAISPSSSWASRLIALLKNSPIANHNVLDFKDFGVCEDWEAFLLER